MISEAKKIINKDNQQEDLVAMGFRKLDDKLIEKRPPKIKWGVIYQGFTDKEKVDYLEKLSASMNHAAYLIQGERNQIGELCKLKDQQVAKLKAAMEQNTKMLQTEITKINEERQSFNREAAKLHKKIRELNNGVLS
jgi:predicted nuclease with TOPRIM domain